MSPSTDTFTTLARANLACAEAAATAWQVTEASHLVIGRRLTLMARALGSPGDADHAELGLMVPEKVAAFSDSATAIGNEVLGAQRDAAAFLWDIGLAAISGWPLPARSLARVCARSSEYGAQAVSRTLGSVGLALAPIHESVTANARRLSGAAAAN